MPRFFIHLRNHNALIEDPEGCDLPDFEAAWDEALAVARELLAEGLDSGQLEVRDEAGRFLVEFPIRDALGLDGVPIFRSARR